MIYSIVGIVGVLIGYFIGSLIVTAYFGKLLATETRLKDFYMEQLGRRLTPEQLDEVIEDMHSLYMPVKEVAKKHKNLTK